MQLQTLDCILPEVHTNLWQDGDAERLVFVLTHQVEGDHWEDVPGCGARLPTYQLLAQPKT